MQDNSVPETTKAFVAGFIDGEACIRVQYMKSKGPTQYIPQIKIAAVKPEVLVFISSIYGGWDRNYQPYSSGNNANRATEWCLQGRTNVLKLMQDILPYCIVKKPQVELMIKFITEAEVSAPPKPVSEAEIARRATIFAKFKELNRRGIQD